MSMFRRAYILRARDKKLELGRRTRVMGVVNITPDSFFDGGRFLERSQAIERCLELAEKGADILDLGGESSRPGAQPVSSEEELNRILPVLQEVRKKVSILISVDTYKAAVAQEAFKEGADLVNDISAFRFDSQLPQVIRKWDAAVVLMHMRGTPESMQEIPASEDILGEIQMDLQAAVSKAAEIGISKERIVIDPGIGFGKTVEDNCRILNQLSFLKAFDLPLLVGTSRKKFLGKILNLPPQERIWGSAASIAISIMQGAHIVRLHDVKEMNQVAQITDAILAEGPLQ
ncbi:dihydropteroate synthase [Acidobacteria bacterium AH-259-D05]|nr:dihydropteroate synthase [Acidobacteria bacterium AH-259-D05]